MTKSIDKQLAEAESKLAVLKKKRSELKAKERAKKRKDDTREKILVGAAILSIIENKIGGVWIKNEEGKATSIKLNALLDKIITSPKDRAFLNLDDKD